MQAFIKRKYNLFPSLNTVRYWIRNKEQFLCLTEKDLTKRANRRSNFETLEKVLHEVLVDYETCFGHIDDHTIRGHAHEVAAKLGYDGFEPVTGKQAI